MVIPVNVFQVVDASKPSYVLAYVENPNLAKSLMYINFNNLVMLSGKHPIKFVKYSGSAFGCRLDGITNAQAVALRANSIRGRFEFATYMKTLFPQLWINPISIQNATIDSPYIYWNGVLLCEWRSAFEKNLSENSFKLESHNTIIRYEFVEPIFILKEDTKRHVAAENKEIVLINLSTGVITRSWKQATETAFYERDSIFQNGCWNVVYNNVTPIAGYKLRR